MVITGCQEAPSFGTTPGVDLVTLPALGKQQDGRYEPKRLGVSLRELIAIRSQIIEATIRAYEPDLLIVDKVPRGALGELDNVLCQLRTRGTTRVVLGLREVLDAPETAIEEWHRDLSDDTVRRFYDAVWVYGDANVYDLVREYDIAPDIARKFVFTGYFDQKKRLQMPALRDETSLPVRNPAEPIILCVVGGGQDGGNLALNFAQARFAANQRPTLIAGPFMPNDIRGKLRRMTSDRRRFNLVQFSPEADIWIEAADRVIAMAGYNTACSILSFGKPALLVPRVQPRREQLIRASRLRDLGIADLVHPDQLTPGAIEQWTRRVDVPHPSSGPPIDLEGLSRVRQLAIQLVGKSNR